MSGLPRIAVGVEAHSPRHVGDTAKDSKHAGTYKLQSPHHGGETLPPVTPTSSHPETVSPTASSNAQTGSPVRSKKYRRKSMNGKKKDCTVTEELTTTEQQAAEDESSVSSYSSSGSDDSSRSQSTKTKESRKLGSVKKATLKKVISATALQTAAEVISAATGSAKLGLKKNIKEDMVMHGKHVLLTKGATIPHITLNVDAQAAREIDCNARKLPTLTRAQTCHNGVAATTAQKLLRSGVSEDVVRSVETYAELDTAPGFAKKTMAALIHDAGVVKHGPLV